MPWVALVVVACGADTTTEAALPMCQQRIPLSWNQRQKRLLIQRHRRMTQEVPTDVALTEEPTQEPTDTPVPDCVRMAQMV
ncbi:MAG: hypothetical protein Q9P01_02715 [Anaerolineae bacterium]|nr:hypothetical protein [Anaerolineae bacterium]